MELGSFWKVQSRWFAASLAALLVLSSIISAMHRFKLSISGSNDVAGVSLSMDVTGNEETSSKQAQIPVKLKQLRACLLCNLVKSFDQFIQSGCDNCEPILGLRGDSERVLDCTTTSYSGTVAVMSPKESWVARWQRIDGAKAGLYAGRVFGRLPEGLEEDLERRGIRVPESSR